LHTGGWVTGRHPACKKPLPLISKGSLLEQVEEETAAIVLRPFFQDDPGEPVSEESFFWTYGARKDNKRQIHNPGGRHSIQTNQQSTSINPPTFMPDALPAAILPIYPGLGQAQEYAGLEREETG